MHRCPALVDEATTTHEIIQITKHGHRAAGAVEDLHQADRDVAAGDSITGQQLRDTFGLPPR